MGEPVEPHHFSASLFPRFAKAFPSSSSMYPAFTLQILKNRFSLPSIHFRHSAQQYVVSPSIPVAIPLSFPFLPTALIAPQSKIRHQEKIKKKKVKFCCQENALTISRRKRFFRKSFVALKFSPKIFLKKYCIAFSFHTVRALSFFLFFLLKNFQRSKIF